MTEVPRTAILIVMPHPLEPPPGSDSISPDGPRCITCSYLLVGLTDARCPECGTPFVRETNRRHVLLPWERLEFGGCVRRLLRTLLFAWCRPTTFFTNLRLRNEIPIGRPVGFARGALVVAILFHVLGALMSDAIFLIRLLQRGVGMARAWHGYTSMPALSFTLHAWFWVWQMAGLLMVVIIMSALCAWLFRSRLAALSRQSLLAALSPLIPLGTLITLPQQVAPSLSTVGVCHIAYLVPLSIHGQTLIVVVFSACLARRLLRFGPVATILAASAGGAIQWGVAHGLWFLFSWILLLLLHR